MCTTIFWCLRLGPSVTWRCAGFLDILSGSVKTRKLSDRWFFVVIEGSKSIASLFSLAARFQNFWFGVRERFPWWASERRGFSLGKVALIWVSASLVHSCGVRQWFVQSLWQSWHLQ